MQNPTPVALQTSARIRLYRRQYKEAIAEIERAIALDLAGIGKHASTGLEQAGRENGVVRPERGHEIRFAPVN